MRTTRCEMLPKLLGFPQYNEEEEQEVVVTVIKSENKLPISCLKRKMATTMMNRCRCMTANRALAVGRIRKKVNNIPQKQNLDHKQLIRKEGMFTWTPSSPPPPPPLCPPPPPHTHTHVSVQFEKAHMRATRLAEVFPPLPFKQFQCSSD